jgi:hypothetical protein
MYPDTPQRIHQVRAMHLAKQPPSWKNVEPANHMASWNLPVLIATAFEIGSVSKAPADWFPVVDVQGSIQQSVASDNLETAHEATSHATSHFPGLRSSVPPQGASTVAWRADNEGGAAQ